MNLAKWLISAFHGIRVSGHTSTRRPYTGDELRAIRKRNGVGRPLYKLGTLQAFQIWHQKVYPALIASRWGQVCPNFTEWQRKPRPTPRGQTVHA
jgi:hypothetical protein